MSVLPLFDFATTSIFWQEASISSDFIETSFWKCRLAMPSLSRENDRILLFIIVGAAFFEGEAARSTEGVSVIVVIT